MPPEKKRPKLSKYEKVIAVYPKIQPISTWVDMCVVIQAPPEPDTRIDIIKQNELSPSGKEKLNEIAKLQQELLDEATYILRMRNKVEFRIKTRKKT